jgi:histidinol phosphatase-like PHP family hydrolase
MFAQLVMIHTSNLAKFGDIYNMKAKKTLNTFSCSVGNCGEFFWEKKIKKKKIRQNIFFQYCQIRH